MSKLYERSTTTNGYMHRRRPPDAFERLLAALLVSAMVVSALLAVAVGVGAIWLTIVIVQDIARRLGA